mmetsp:Transcript_32264/g.70285  ORF Transcript_32264/g.70285 Transcript_32264/m.70285 type:complete len:112 (+) Transcript_32264:416-751(+)
MEKALGYAIRKIEMEYIEKVKGSFNLGFNQVAKVGTCLLACMISKQLDHKISLVIANMGDCEAALIKNVDRAFSSCRLNNLHSANNVHEVKRLQLEHPHESDVVKGKNGQH